MGEVDSGRRRGAKPKQTTERVPSIDIRQLRRQGYLNHPVDGTFTWSIAGVTICAIGFRINSTNLILNYQYCPNGGEWVQAQQNITLTETKCNYGGTRQWFLCSKCNRRIAALYYLTGGFFCRHCHNLTYASQQESKEYRMMRKARKIRQRLGASENLFEPLWEKPKNMHQVTFDRLRREAEHANSLLWSSVLY